MRPQSVRMASLFYLVTTVFALSKIGMLVGLIPAATMIDVVVMTLVQGFVVLQMYRLKPWAIYAYLLLALIGSFGVVSATSLPMVSSLIALTSFGLGVWVFLTTGEIRGKIDLEKIIANFEAAVDPSAQRSSVATDSIASNTSVASTSGAERRLGEEFKEKQDDKVVGPITTDSAPARTER